MSIKASLGATSLVLSLAAAPMAHAAVTWSTGEDATKTQVSLSSAGLNGGSVATLAPGGTVYTADQPFADIPKGGVFENKFLAAGPSSGNPAVLTFNTAINYLSFLWGSPDSYNALKITTAGGTDYNLGVGDFGFGGGGDQSFSGYVQFFATAGDTIKSVTFSSNQDAFEVANFRINAVPEPSTWALMILGFGLIGASMRRKQRQTVRYSFA